MRVLGLLHAITRLRSALMQAPTPLAKVCRDGVDLRDPSIRPSLNAWYANLRERQTTGSTFCVA